MSAPDALASEASTRDPVGPAARDALRPSAPADGAVGDPRFNILIVDDRRENLVAFEAILGELGQNIVCAGSAREALRELLHREFALILLDVNMPDVDGFEAAALIRQRPRTQGTPIIFVTAGTPQETQLSRGYSLGAVDYLYTPVVREVLQAKVGAFIDIARRTEFVRRQEELLRRSAEQRAADLEHRLQSLLEVLAVGVFRASEDGILEEANPAFLNLLGCSSLEDARATCLAFNDDRGGLLSAPEGGELRRDVAIPAPDSTVRWMSLAKTVRPGVAGRVVEGIAVDITDRRRASEELRAANTALTATNADLAQFAYAASHDLQEPLRAMSLYSEMLQTDHEDRLDPEGRRLLGEIVRGAARMERMLRGLLEYSRIGQTAPATEEVDSSAALDDALDILRQGVEQARATIQRSQMPRVRLHRSQLTQVFQNLVGNAIKYRSEAPPVIRIGAQRQGGEWIFSVADNGVGMDPRFADGAFGLFTRLHGSAIPGAGVGLALCRRIVERHGGRIWVETTPGLGSTFSFSLPA